jgi:hypothetical protein
MLLLRQSLIRLVTLFFLRKGNRLKWEADNSHPSSSEANNVTNFTTLRSISLLGLLLLKHNLQFKISVFKIMTAYALRTMQSVPLECRYVRTRLHQLHSILPITLVQSLEHINGSFFLFHQQTSFLLILEISKTHIKIAATCFGLRQ